MKKIQFKSLSWTEAGLLRAALCKQLIAQHPDIKERDGQILITEAWNLDDRHTKVRGSVQQAEGYYHFTRIIDPTQELPIETPQHDSE